MDSLTTSTHDKEIFPDNGGSDLFVMPTSSGQQRLWFLDHWEPGSATYNIPTAIRLRGRVDTDALARVFATLIRRHESLRTTFELENGRPVQVIHPAVELAPAEALPITDLRGLPPAERETQAEAFIQENARQPFDLTSGPLHRRRLVCLGDEVYLLLICTHHIISDGWSMDVLLRELAALYAGENLMPLPLQYADYAVWQQEWLTSPAHEAQLAYWRQQLGGDLPPLDLPTDYTRPPIQTHESARTVAAVSAALTDRLRTLSRQQNGTLFMTLLAAFQLLLHRLSGQADLTVGTPIAGRNLPEVEGLIGFFLNSLVLRSRFDGRITFAEFLHLARQTTLTAYQHQEIPFESLLTELKPERDLSRTPLFQVFFNMLTAGGDRLALPGVTAEMLTPPVIGSKFDMTLYVQEEDGGLTLTFDYNAGLFTPARMAVMLDQYTHLLAQIAANLDQAVGDYTLCTKATAQDLPDPTLPLDAAYEGSVPDAVSRWAAATPDKVAVSDTLVSWTYAELEAFSNRLARYLSSQGVKSGDVVAIYGYRNAALVTVVLSILKAGAAFLILDPAYPAQRLVTYLKLAQPTGWLQISAAGKPPIELINCLDSLSISARLTIPSHKEPVPALNNLPATPPPATIGPDDLAYISFTSGSTGQPKGIQGRHGSLTHFYPWMAKQFNLSAADRFCALSGLAHDPLQRDLFTPLWLGGTVCLPDPTQIGVPGWVANWLAREGVTIANLTPAMGQLIATLPDEEETAVATISSLRYAFFVGDVLTRQDVDKLSALCPNLTVVNFYGSTETQRAVSYHVVTPQPVPDAAVPREVIPLGQGMKDVQLLLLNQARQLAGVGEVAEIYFRSPHLALGYLGDHAQTEARFRPNPFIPDDPTDRVYRSGDLGRYLPDGTVTFVSRADYQVKIRGFRVELGEIDAVINQHKAVQQSITISHQDENTNETSLAAYIVLKTGETATEPDIRNYLQKRFPFFMVPANIVILDALPLTPNGKVDRRALPTIKQANLKTKETFIHPRNEVEEKLARIWENILNRHPISMDDNFFELGGHSLQTISMFAQIKIRFGIDIPPVLLFKSPTIEKLAQNMMVKEAVTLPNILVPIVPEGSNPPFYFVHGGAGYVIHFKKLADYLNTDQPFYGIQPRGWDEHRVAPVTIDSMATAYIQEIRSVQPKGPYYLGGFSLGGLIAFEMARQLKEAGETVGILALLDPTPITMTRSNNLIGRVPGQQNHRIPPNKKITHKLSRHRQNMRKLTPNELVPYIWTSGYGSINYGFNEIKRQLFKLYLKTNRPIPSRWRNYYLMRMISRNAIMAYRPLPYNGRVALFVVNRKSNLDLYSDWKNIVTGDMITYTFETTHTAILQEPYIIKVAEILRNNI